ncbi:hypothetical protein GCM10017581_099080 [Dactylosporangium matsuzakiense]|uniref:Uncharacterized protein n=1 Tax=Dactylosporangium matsuzakiense TaxID=53360 RepID=A0A9W6KVN7_9ACTN|nr:hypothetical protein GCM10017581_099080 [Dactylosporangium matsuzakiense]
MHWHESGSVFTPVPDVGYADKVAQLVVEHRGDLGDRVVAIGGTDIRDETQRAVNRHGAAALPGGLRLRPGAVSRQTGMRPRLCSAWWPPPRARPGRRCRGRDCRRRRRQSRPAHGVLTPNWLTVTEPPRAVVA